MLRTPAFLFPELAGATPFRPEVVGGLDLVILRELTGDLYFGQPRGIEIDTAGERFGINGVTSSSRPPASRTSRRTTRSARRSCAR
jgi:3-isopropylmalate dehydrogenase